MRATAPYVLLLLALLPCGTHAAERSGAQRLGDDLFYAGGSVRFQGEVPGDALLAGGDVELEGNVGGDVAAAGGRLSIRGTIGQDLYAAGGEVRVAADIKGNARVAGGVVELSADARIGEGMTIAGGRVEMDGHAAKYVLINGGEVRINGRVDGNVDVAGGQLTLGPNAVIRGTVSFRGREQTHVAPEARVSGGVRNLPPEQWQQASERRILAFIGFAALVWFGGLLLAGALLLILMPLASHTVTDTFRARPWQSVLLGFGVLVAVPAAILGLTITLVGIPLALLLLFAYLLLLPLGYLAALAAVGDWLLPRLVRKRPVPVAWRLLAFAVLLVVAYLLMQVPILGTLVGFFLLLGGVGAIALAAFIYRKHTPFAPAGDPVP
jgi:hypothetical protein